MLATPYILARHRLYIVLEIAMAVILFFLAISLVSLLIGIFAEFGMKRFNGTHKNTWSKYERVSYYAAVTHVWSAVAFVLAIFGYACYRSLK